MTNKEANITIDYLKEMQEGYIEGEGYERYPLPEWYALDKAIEALEQISWIPCSEKLPEEGGDYLITISLDIGAEEPIREVYKDFFCALSQKWLYRDEDAVAWMPLPKPYKRVEE